MNLEVRISKLVEGRGGRTLTAPEARRLLKLTGPSGEWIVGLMRTVPIIGVSFFASEEEDLSEMGVDLLWLNAEQIISEAKECYPGLLAFPAGFLPIGACLIGSGDYYYIRLSSGARTPLFRVLHDHVEFDDDADSDGRLLPTAVETVARSLTAFFRVATLE